MPKEEREQYFRKAAEDLPDSILTGPRVLLHFGPFRLTYGGKESRKVRSLRYGENPPAFDNEGGAAVYREVDSSGPSIASACVIQEGKGLSYNNFVDADAGLRLGLRLHELYPWDSIAVVIKHKGPSGVGRSNSMEFAHKLAYKCDPINAFGGVNVYIGVLDEGTANAITSYFNEVVVAPSYTERALEILRQKKNLRVLLTESPDRKVVDSGIDGVPILGGYVAQRRQVSHINTPANLEKISHGRDPNMCELEAALFTWAVAFHTPSNAIIFGTPYRTVGIGRGQGSRVDSTDLAINFMKEKCRDYNPNNPGIITMASDAFFPEPDSVEHAARAGIRTIVFPLGSVKDDQIIEAADKYNIVMLCTRPIPGAKKIERAFKH
ncbi:MAG: hypothetical protein HY514_03575 [Candidatus Aenigmarchaeota archaeon]|nr:hypothetical protein [Candidatus Aenigmarchaeota archaeon]